jgi:hypothetical protein
MLRFLVLPSLTVACNGLGIAEGRDLMIFRSANVQIVIKAQKFNLAFQPAFWEYLVGGCPLSGCFYALLMS